MIEEKFRVRAWSPNGNQENFIYFTLRDTFDSAFQAMWGHEAINPKWETLGRFTGRTDKNGKEVYEGDVVTCDKISDGAYGDLTRRRITLPTSWDNYVTGFRPFNAWDASIENVEVIGSIFENPELLN